MKTDRSGKEERSRDVIKLLEVRQREKQDGRSIYRSRQGEPETKRNPAMGQNFEVLR